MKNLLLPVFLLAGISSFSQTCFTISNRTNGNGNPGTCGSPNCSGNAKTGHIDVNFGATCPGVIPSLVLTGVTSGPMPSPFCFDPGNCISPGVVRYCFRGTNLPSSGSMTLRLTQGATIWTCSYDVNGGGGTILPVSLSAFNTRMQHGQADLSWKTEQETNSLSFEIERSGDNSHFKQLASVPAHGNSAQPLAYTYTDVSPLKGISYYRLKQVDIDGRFTYSAVKRVDNRVEGLELKNIFPNPVSSNKEMNLEVLTGKPCMLTMNLFSQAGLLVLHSEKRFISGQQNWKLLLPSLSGGVYEVMISDGEGNSLTERLVVANQR
ncbi:MAG: hypothetical protein JNM88_07825 [Chitinophagaceae bacterium]|nr:hypothetical protein [Chitinophagaceae bacterium]